MEPQTDLREIVRRLGAGDIHSGGKAATVPGPGHSLKDRSLSLRVSDDGARVLWFSHANDDAAAVFRHLGIEGAERENLSGPELQRRREARAKAIAADRARKLAFCRQVWADTLPAEGSLVALYLRGRGLAGSIPEALRFHPSAPLAYPTEENPSPRRAPAMVAIASGPDGTSCGLHVTILKPDGSGKAPMRNPRLMFGDLAGAAVRLGPVPVGGELGVAEGIETAVSYRDLTGVPTWAALSTAGLARFTPPLGIVRLVVAADSDPAGIKAARELAERASRRVECVVAPAPEGSDWNDVIQGGRA